eukprot:4172240-Prymnesium_polylepis.1
MAGGFVEEAPPDPRALERALRRRVEVLGRRRPKVVPLVERPLAYSADDGDAVARVLDAKRVVIDEGVFRTHVLVPRRRRLRLQLLPHIVLDALPRASERVAPHLEHPTEGRVGRPICLEIDRQLIP